MYMKIGIFTDTYLPDINGVVTSVEMLNERLTKLGHEVYIISTYKGVTKIKREGNVLRLPGVEIKKLYGYKVAQPIHLLFIKEIASLKLDIIHAETEFGVGIFANIVSSTLNIPLVRTYHTSYEDYIHYLKISNSKTVDKYLKKAVAEISKLYCNNCVKLISPSNKTAEMLKNYGVNTEIEIVPTGINLTNFERKNINIDKIKEIKDKYKIKTNEKLLLYVGRIAEEKSIDIIIKAFGKVRAEKLDLKLMIVGDGPYLNNLKDLVAKLDLDSCVFFVGKIPFADIVPYYHAADAFISASKSETQGITYIEAIASELIVMVRDHEVLDEIVIDEKNGYFFDSVDSLYACIKKFSMLDKSEYAKMKEYGKNLIKKYDADVFAKESLRIYEEAIEDYKNSFVINKVSLKDDCVSLTLLGFDSREEKLLVSLDNYYELGLRKDSKITKLIYDILKSKENEALAYRSSLKRLAMKDYSEKEMKDYLNNKYELSPYSLNVIIDKLKENNLIDDYRYALGKISSFNSSFLSKKAITIKLLKAGISNEIINKCLIDDNNQELLNAKRRAEKYMNSIKNKSINLKKKTIYSKLLSDGFSYDIAKEAMSVLDYTNDVLNEDELLRKEFNKAKKKYEKKYEGSELRNKIYMLLLSKGFSYDNIYAIINEMEV